MLRRFAALGDIHAEADRLALALAWLADQHLDAVLAVGDIVDGPDSPDRCCALLRDHHVVTVRGNHDRWLLADEFRHYPDAHRRADLAPDTLAFLTALPPTLRLPTVRGDLLLCHGVGPDDMRRLVPSTPGLDFDLDHLGDPTLHLAVGGHTHQRMVRTFPRPGAPPLIVLNPGTLRAPQRSHVPESGLYVVDLEAARVDVHDLIESPPGALRLVHTATLPLVDDPTLE